MGNAKHGKKTVVKVADAAATLTDISNSCNNLDFSEEVELLESTAFQDTDKTWVVGFKDNKFSIQGRWTLTIDTLFGGILGLDTAVAFQLGPEGSTTGSRKYTGVAFCVSFKKTGAVNALNSFTAEFQIDGSVTRALY